MSSILGWDISRTGCSLERVECTSVVLAVRTGRFLRPTHPKTLVKCLGGGSGVSGVQTLDTHLSTRDWPLFYLLKQSVQMNNLGRLVQSQTSWHVYTSLHCTLLHICFHPIFSLLDNFYNQKAMFHSDLSEVLLLAPYFLFSRQSRIQC